MNAPATPLTTPHDETSATSSPLRRVPPEGLSAPRSGARSANLAFYAACADALEHERVIWDVGCGDGRGTSVLCAKGRTVLGFGFDDASLEQAKVAVPAASFSRALPTAVSDERAPDVIVLGDALGYLEDPDSLLLELGGLAKATTQLWVWEPRAEPTQELPFPKRRAWTAIELRELAELCGWQKHSEPAVCATTNVLLATRGPTTLVQALTQLARRNADVEVQSVGKLPPDLMAALQVRRAFNALQANDGNTATAAFLAALEHAPSHSLALAGLAHLALSCGSLTDATQILRRCLETDPVNLQALQLWATVLGLTKPDERLCAYQTLARLSPADATITSSLAQLHADAGDPLLAIQDLERLRRYHPEPNIGLSLTLGWLLLSIGRKSDAEVELRLAALLDPDSAEVQELRAALSGG